MESKKLTKLCFVECPLDAPCECRDYLGTINVAEILSKQPKNNMQKQEAEDYALDRSKKVVGIFKPKTPWEILNANMWHLVEYNGTFLGVANRFVMQKKKNEEITVLKTFVNGKETTNPKRVQS